MGTIILIAIAILGIAATGYTFYNVSKKPEGTTEVTINNKLEMDNTDANIQLKSGSIQINKDTRVDILFYNVQYMNGAEYIEYDIYPNTRDVLSIDKSKLTSDVIITMHYKVVTKESKEPTGETSFEGTSEEVINKEYLVPGYERPLDFKIQLIPIKFGASVQDTVNETIKI